MSEIWKNKSFQNLTIEYDGVLYEEEWAQIKGYENYSISTFGRVKSLPYLKAGNGGSVFISESKFLSQIISDRGYLRVSLYNNAKKKEFRVHQLVATAFVIGKSEAMNEVNHEDGDKLNNFYKNLSWDSRSGNVKHAFDNGLMKANKGLDHNHSRLVLHSEYGVFCNIKEASEISNKLPSNMWKELNGQRINKTKFKLV